MKGETILDMFEVWKNNDITLEEFRKEFFD